MSELQDYREKVIKMAKETYQSEGSIEIDDTALISDGEDNGAYVSAWVWVDFSDTDLDKENAKEDN